MELPPNLVQQIINYLTQKPWAESNPLIVEIMKHVPKEEKKNAVQEQSPASEVPRPS